MSVKKKFYEYGVSPWMFNNIGENMVYLLLIGFIAFLLNLSNEYYFKKSAIWNSSKLSKPKKIFKYIYNETVKAFVWNLCIMFYLNHTVYYSLFIWVNLIFASTASFNGRFNFSLAILFKIS